MNPDLTKRLEEIGKRAEKATPGPWEWSYHPSHHDDVIALEGTINGIGQDVLLCTSDEDEAWGEISPEDDSFIAHARQDIPFLLDLVESIRARTLEEAAKIAETYGGQLEALRPTYDGIAAKIRALITQPPPDYEAVAKRAAEKIVPYVKVSMLQDEIEGIAAIILTELNGD